MGGVYVKTAGIIGGIGPESTMAYYRALIASYRARSKNVGAPSLLINSIDMSRMLRGFDENRHADVTAYLTEEVGRLQRGGADFAALSSVTPHIVFEDLRARVT